MLREVLLGNGCVNQGIGGALVQSERCLRFVKAFQVWDGTYHLQMIINPCYNCPEVWAILSDHLWSQ